MARRDSLRLRRFARPALRILTHLVWVSVVLVGVAHAETLQRLTVTQLTLSSDTATPHVETPFHLVITAHVRERVGEIDNLVLPILAELELLGDEHTVTTTVNGTTYRETITVIAHTSGEIHIMPVTLDAIDARNGKAMRYFSNALTINVGGLSPASAGADLLGALRTFVVVLFKLILFLAGVAALVLVVVLLLRRRRMPEPEPEPIITLAPPTPVQRDPRALLHDALAALRGDPTRTGAMRARHLVRQMVGASDTETLADVLSRPSASDPEVQNALRALERAGFTHDTDLGPAIAAAAAQLERMTR